MPTASQADFTPLVTLSEVLSAQSLPPGPRSSTDASADRAPDGGEDRLFTIAPPSPPILETFAPFNDFTRARNTNLATASVLGI